MCFLTFITTFLRLTAEVQWAGLTGLKDHFNQTESHVNTEAMSEPIKSYAISPLGVASVNIYF